MYVCFQKQIDVPAWAPDFQSKTDPRGNSESSAHVPVVDGDLIKNILDSDWLKTASPSMKKVHPVIVWRAF